MTLIAAILLGTIAVFYLYEVKQEGVLELDNAQWGTAHITREVETEIPHIRGENYNAMIYAQGFAHA
jgi:acyl-homoserine lactone acylase PvdQ